MTVPVPRSQDTLAISVAPLVLEEAIYQLDAYNLRLKQAKGHKKKVINTQPQTQTKNTLTWYHMT